MGDIIYWKPGEIPKEHRGQVTDEDMIFGEWVCNDDRVEKAEFYSMAGSPTGEPHNLMVMFTFKNGDTHSRNIVPPFTYENKIIQAEQYLKQLK